MRATVLPGTASQTAPRTVWGRRAQALSHLSLAQNRDGAHFADPRGANTCAQFVYVTQTAARFVQAVQPLRAATKPSGFRLPRLQRALTGRAHLLHIRTSLRSGSALEVVHV